MRDVVVEERFRGPPQSGNGGYVGGLFSKTIDPSGRGDVEVTLRSPIPLDKHMQVNRLDDGTAAIMDGEILDRPSETGPMGNGSTSTTRMGRD